MARNELSAEQQARTEALKMVMARRDSNEVITESTFGIADRLAHYILTGQASRHQK